MKCNKKSLNNILFTTKPKKINIKKMRFAPYSLLKIVH